MLAQGGEPTQPGGGGGGAGGTPIQIDDVWLDREYVYVPSNAGGYVDEFIAQIDRFNDVWFVLQDANFNVLGLTDSGGELVEQRTYDPYGELLTRESFAAHPGFKAGHQGLFFDRLDPPAPVGGSVSMGAASQLEPNTFGLYQVRNRVLLPRYGRWAQKDPNASGMVLAMRHEPTAYQTISAESPDIALVSRDGLNLSAALRSSPQNYNDPYGLFGIVSGLMTGLSLADMSENLLDTAYQGVSAGAKMYEQVSGYAFWQEYWIDWALNWDSIDDRITPAEATTQSMSPYASMASVANRGPGSMMRTVKRAAKISSLSSPSIRQVVKGIETAQKKLKSSVPRASNSDLPHKGPRWESDDGLRGYRLEPPQHGKGWHIDWFDWTGGKRGKGGRNGTIELDAL